MKTTRKHSMLVVRGFPRYAEAAFYNSFPSFDVTFVGSNSDLHAQINKTLPHIRTEVRSLVPYALFDPISVFSGSINHHSWVILDELEELIKKTDIVNITDLYFFYGYEAVRLAKKYNKKTISVVWENKAHHISSKIPPYAWIVSYLARSVDLFVLRSSKALEFTDSLGIDRARTTVLYKGVVTQMFNSRKPMVDPVRFLYVGQISNDKGVDDLLEAFHRLNRYNKNIRLDIVGDGPLRSRLSNQYRSPEIHFHGHLPYLDMLEYYNKAHIFVSPSKRVSFGPIVLFEERFSYTLMEAQAAGCAIIGTYCGGIPEEIGDRNILVNQGDVNGLERAMSDYLNNPKRMIATGKRNRTRAIEKFDLFKQAKKMDNKVLKLLES